MVLRETPKQFGLDGSKAESWAVETDTAEARSSWVTGDLKHTTNHPVPSPAGSGEPLRHLGL